MSWSIPTFGLASSGGGGTSTPADAILLTPAPTIAVDVLDRQVYTLVVGVTDVIDLVPGNGAFDGATSWIVVDNTAGGTLTVDGSDALDAASLRVTFVATDASAGEYDALVGAVL